MQDWIEVELKIDGGLESVEKTLLSNDFVLFYKRHIMTNYYLPKNVSLNETDLKSKCVRLRKSIRLDKNGIDKDGISVMNPKGELTDDENLEKEKQLLVSHTLLFTDDKLDFVFQHKDYEKNRIMFQIQQIKGIGLIVAYFNKNYYGKPNQRELLIKDIENYGLKILDYRDVDRLSVLKAKQVFKLSFSQVIDRLNKEKI